MTKNLADDYAAWLDKELERYTDNLYKMRNSDGTSEVAIIWPIDNVTVIRKEDVMGLLQILYAQYSKHETMCNLHKIVEKVSGLDCSNLLDYFFSEVHIFSHFLLDKLHPEYSSYYVDDDDEIVTDESSRYTALSETACVYSAIFICKRYLNIAFLSEFMLKTLIGCVDDKNELEAKGFVTYKNEELALHVDEILKSLKLIEKSVSH